MAPPPKHPAICLLDPSRGSDVGENRSPGVVASCHSRALQRDEDLVAGPALVTATLRPTTNALETLVDPGSAYADGLKPG